MEEDWIWTYRTQPTDSSKPPSSYDLKTQPLGTGYSESYLVGGKPAGTVKYRCDQGGQINLTPPSIAGATLTRAVVTGYSIPAAANWKEGYSWSCVWDIAGRKGILSGTATITVLSKVLGREQVTVPAGTFNAWKVQVQTVLDAKMGVIPLSQTLPDQTQWYVENVGLVQLQDKDQRVVLLNLKK